MKWFYPKKPKPKITKPKIPKHKKIDQNLNFVDNFYYY